MTALRAIFRRELLATFATPVAYVTLALLASLLGAIFVVVTLRTGEPATLRVAFLAAAWALLAAAPAMSMRSFSEEFRQGTWETLLAAPIRPWHAVLAKFLAGCVFLAVLVGVPSLVLAIVLELHGDPDWGEMASGYGGLMLASAAFLAIGILASTLTSNQLVAFLVPVFVMFALSLGSRALGAILPAEWASIAFGADPLRRVEDFVLGLVDTANVVYFIAVTAAALAIASVSLGRVREGGFGGRARTALGRLAWRGEALVFALGALAAAGAATALAGVPILRAEIDGTKTRAYSLSPSSEELARSLSGDWTIAMLVGNQRADLASLRRVDEVLANLTAANPTIRTERIDPDDARSGAQFEALLERLARADAPALAAWTPALESAFAGYDELRSFAREELQALLPVIAGLAADATLRPQLEQLAGGLAQLTDLSNDAGESFIESVRTLLRTSATRPLPDYEGARSALVANDRLWADQFGTVATLARGWSASAQLPDGVRAWAKSRGEQFERQATRCRTEQYALEELPDLASGDVGRIVGEGECAVILSPRGAIAIPSWQLVPAAGSGQGRSRLGFDFAARAEQTLAGAIRSLSVERMPMVCFVHSEDRSLLARAEDRNELVAVADALKTARFAVREWPVTTSATPPAAAKGQTTVFVIVPPLKREGLQVSEREKRLLEVTRGLIARREPLLVTFARNLLPIFGQKDPWDNVARELGVTVDTGRVILELVPTSADKTETRPWQEVERMNVGHPIGAAVSGQPAIFNHPNPISTLPSVSAVTIASIEPGANRWLEDDWRGDGLAARAVPTTKRLSDAIPIVVAIERDDAATKRHARAVVIGSGGWLLSAIADAAQSLGGDRYSLTSPGNRGLMLASVAWLAGLDATGYGGANRESARVGEVSDASRATWFVILVGGVPLAITAAGVGVWMRRRRDV
ncbi:MAG: ABC transporter permease [Phycisphaerae bacterium]|nr:ABC transporter permease [Phycisphaerae bacterium]